MARGLAANRRAEADYVTALRGIQGALRRAVESATIPLLTPERGDGRRDAKDPVGKASDIVRRSEKDVAKRVANAFTVMANRVKVANGQSFRSLLGVRYTDLGIDAAIAEAQRANVDLVINAGRVYAAQVEEIFTDPDLLGARVETLQRMLLERGNVTESRAELIARDQTLKTNGAINKARQQNAGVSKYTWSASGDDRVRPSHRAVDGKVFSWDAPPDFGHPGEDYQCRCVAVPVLEEFSAEGLEGVDEEIANPFGGEAFAAPVQPEVAPEPLANPVPTLEVPLAEYEYGGHVKGESVPAFDAVADAFTRKLQGTESAVAVADWTTGSYREMVEIQRGIAEPPIDYGLVRKVKLIEDLFESSMPSGRIPGVDRMFRGLTLSEKDFATFVTSDYVENRAMASYSRFAEEASKFTDASSRPGKVTIVVHEPSRALPIEGLSTMPEGELLAPKGQRYRVISRRVNVETLEAVIEVLET